MQALLSVVTPIFAKIRTAVGVTGTSAAATGLGIASAVVTGISQISAANYQASVATRAALVREQNANRIIAAGRQEARMQDEAAAVAVADDIAAQGASGFALSSPSFVRRRARQTVLMQQDRQNIVEDANLQAASEREGAAALRSEAKQAKQSALFSFLSTGFNAFDSMIGGSNLVSDLASRRIKTRATVVSSGF